MSHTMEICVDSVMDSADEVLLIHFLNNEAPTQHDDRKLMVAFSLPDVITKKAYRRSALRGSIFCSGPLFGMMCLMP